MRVQDNAASAVPPHRRRSLIWGMLCAVLAALLVSGSVLVAPLIKSPAQAAAEADPPPASKILVDVERRTLTSDVVLRGVVQAGPHIALNSSQAILGEAPIITKLPLSGGASLSEGSVLLEANGEPVFTMDWAFSPYRDITAGIEGPDVLQLQNTLINLGYSASQTSVMDWYTQNALSAFYLDRGYKVPMEPEQPTAPNLSLDEKQASPTGIADSGEIKGDDSSLSQARKEESTTPFLPKTSVLVVPENGHTLSSMEVAVGQVISADNPIIATLDASPPRVVAVVQPEAAKSISPGDIAILSDDRNGRSYELKVNSVGTVTEEIPSVGNGLKITLAFTGDVTDITAEGTTLRLVTSTGEASNPVLAVPITAIFTQSDGMAHATLADGRNVEVQVGDTINGWVEITPSEAGAIAEGDQVVVGYQGAN